MSSQADSTASVRAYYDQNTRLFACLGSSSQARSIHRALWPAGVTSLDQALNQSNQLVLQAIQPLLAELAARAFTLADLGCGIGGTLIYLLQHLPETSLGLGLTISPVQARMARQHLAHMAPSRRGLILEGDFQALPVCQGFDAFISIEAFVHSPHPRQYLAETARGLRCGGRLVLVDDFLSHAQPPADPGQRRWLQSYRSGWRVPGLSLLQDICDQAGSLGLKLVENRNLTPDLRFRTLPNFLTGLLLSHGERLPLRHAIWPSMLGSLALQHCLKAGLVEYRLVVFEKQG